MESTSRKQVLFVSRDEDYRKQTQNLLALSGSDWTPVFVTDPRAGLVTLMSEPSAVRAMVFDTELKDFDSTTFLTRAREKVPHIARLLLAEHTPETVRRVSSPAALSILPRSCDAETLDALLDRVSTLHQRITCEPVTAILDEVEYLPALPNTYKQLTEATSGDEVDFKEIAAIIESDPVMTLKVLHLVNSAGFGVTRQIPSVFMALQYLGLDLLKGLLLASQVIQGFERIRTRSFSIDTFQRYSTRVAGLARCFAVKSQREEALMGGILHDIGELIIALRRPEELAQVIEQALETGERTWRIEEERLGATHGDVGAGFLARWGLPLPILECVAYHQHPADAARGGSETLATVHAAEAFVSIATSGEDESCLDVNYLRTHGYGEALHIWREIADAQAQSWRD